MSAEARRGKYLTRFAGTETERINRGKLVKSYMLAGHNAKFARSGRDIDHSGFPSGIISGSSDDLSELVK